MKVRIPNVMLLSLYSSMSENLSSTLSGGRVSEEDRINPKLVEGINVNSKIICLNQNTGYTGNKK